MGTKRTKLAKKRNQGGQGMGGNQRGTVIKIEKLGMDYNIIFFSHVHRYIV